MPTLDENLALLGGYSKPPQVSFCPKCQRDRPTDEMVRETCERSLAFGRLVCNRPGCYIGPYPDVTVVIPEEPASKYPYD